MKKNYNEILDGKLVPKALEITIVLTVVFYIVFSVIKRFSTNEQMFWIPVILFASNFLVLLELVYLTKTKKLNSTKKEFIGLLSQTVLNLAFVIFILTFLF
jgi:hypothetical protein